MNFRARVLGWIVVVIALAIAARLVWEMLRPLLPLLVALLALGLLYAYFGRRWFG